MSDLANFILARIAEEETAARDLLRHAQKMEPALRHVKWLGGLVPGGHSWSDVRCQRRSKVDPVATAES